MSDASPATTTTPASAPTDDQKAWTKQLGRARVFIFFFAFVVVAIGNAVGEENDIALHVADDYADIAIAIIGVIVLATMWKKGTAALRKANNISTVLAVLLIVATIFAITQEYNDPTDFGNEIPTLLFGIFMIINRFV